MKVKELFEQRSGISEFDFSVEYELEYTTPDGEVDYKTVEITGTVTETSDAYGTGDSPTDYEVNVETITDTETGNAIPESAIPTDDWEKIEQQAIESVNRRRQYLCIEYECTINSRCTFYFGD